MVHHPFLLTQPFLLSHKKTETIDYLIDNLQHKIQRYYWVQIETININVIYLENLIYILTHKTVIPITTKLLTNFNAVDLKKFKMLIVGSLMVSWADWRFPVEVCCD